ncbi:MAG: hypothetical protein ACREFQ_04520 [Stellaceae bacterium]
MKNVVQGAAGVASAGIVTGVSYWVQLFYQTPLTDYRWPASVQNLTLMVCLFAGVGVSVLYAGVQKNRLKRFVTGAFFVTLCLLLISFSVYKASQRHDWWLLNDAWQFVDLLAMVSLVMSISLFSQLMGSSVWEWFTGRPPS